MSLLDEASPTESIGLQRKAGLPLIRPGLGQVQEGQWNRAHKFKGPIFLNCFIFQPNFPINSTSSEVPGNNDQRQTEASTQ